MDVRNNERFHRFEIEGGGDVAFLTYRIDDGAIELIHAEVPQSLSGRGIAGSLAEAAFDFARSQHLQVVVICPYVARWLERHPEHGDVVRRIERRRPQA